jgi:hypothetical protein
VIALYRGKPSLAPARVLTVGQKLELESLVRNGSTPRLPEIAGHRGRKAVSRRRSSAAAWSTFPRE